MIRGVGTTACVAWCPGQHGVMRAAGSKNHLDRFADHAAIKGHAEDTVLFRRYNLDDLLDRAEPRVLVRDIHNGIARYKWGCDQEPQAHSG